MISELLKVVVRENKGDFFQYDKPSGSIRLDEFYGHFLCHQKYANFAKVVMKVLTFSHGQASVERWFSVNKTLMIEFLSIISLVSQRVNHDYMNVNYILPHNINTTDSLRRYIKSASQRYQHHFEDQPKCRVSNEK